MTRRDNDGFTVAAIAILAMCLVTFDHEVLGHGGACVLLGGRITAVTSSIFRCSVRSVWIDPAGPCANLLIGTLALWLWQRVPSRAAGTRLFLLLVNGFSYFWESGYLVDAMRVRHGDLYFAALDWLGEPSFAWRVTGIMTGIALFIITVSWLSRALRAMWADAAVVRRVSRTAWTAASLAAAAAAAAYAGSGWGDFKDAVLEIAVSSGPLLLMPLGRGRLAERTLPVPARTSLGAANIPRNGVTIAAGLIVYAVFVATLGRGLP